MQGYWHFSPRPVNVSASEHSSGSRVTFLTQLLYLVKIIMPIQFSDIYLKLEIKHATFLVLTKWLAQ